MNERKQIGLAVIGCGVVGRMRSTFAKDYPGIGWIGLADINEAATKMVLPTRTDENG